MKRRGYFFKGQMAVVMTFAIATLLGAMALGTDVAVMYFNWVQLQKTADAAALAGAGWLVSANVSDFYTGAAATVAAGCSGQPDVPSKAACTYVANNNLPVDAKSLQIVENSKSLPAAAPTPNIQVWVNRSNIPYLFGKVIGLDTYSVSAKATGIDEYVGTYSGPLFPVIMQCAGKCPSLSSMSAGLAVSFGAKFADVGASGNWQFLNVGGTGGKNLGDAIAGGTGATDLSIGSTIGTKTGITWGDVSSGWNTRMSAHNTLCSAGSLSPENCADPSSACTMASSGTKIPSNDPLLVTVPVGDLTGCTGSCSVNITGFALVYLYSLSKSSSTIQLSGCFVQQTDPNGGGGVAGAPNLGAIAPASLIQ